MSETEPPPAHKSLYPLKFQPLLCLSVAFLFGVAAGDLFSLKTALWTGVGIIGLGIGLILLYQFHHSFEFQRLHWQKTFPLNPGWMILFFALGILRLLLVQPVFTEKDVAFYNENGKATFTAIVIQPPNVKNHTTTLTVQVRTIHPFYSDYETGISPVNGRMRVTTYNAGEFHYGDELRIICTPETPQNFTDFNFQRYLAARKTYTTCDYAYAEVIAQDAGNPILKLIFGLREQAQKAINSILPPDEAALLSGILLGNEDHIAPEVETAFQRTGTSHIIAISGANFTVLITFITTLFLRHLPRKWVIPVSIILITFYTILVGGNAAVVRAAIMGTLSVFGTYFGRRNQGLNTLAFSAALFVLVNPLILWDLGFQLSVGATLGLVLFSERWSEGIGNLLLKFLSEEWTERLQSWIGEYVLMTLAAQVFTLPLIAYTFRHVSLSAFLINIFILPVQPIIMAIGGLATMTGMLLPFLGQLLGWLAWIPLAYTIKIVEWGSTWNWSEIILPSINPAALWGYFAIVFSWPLFLGHLPKRKRIVNQSALLLFTAGFVIILWTIGLQHPTEDFQLYLFPLEESTAVLLELPDGKAILMGRSDSMDDLNHEIEEVLSGYQLSVFIQPDAGWQAFNRIENLTAHYPITEIFVNPEIEADTAAQLMSQLNAGTNLQQLTKKQTIQLMNGINLTTLTVRDESAAFLLEYENLRILMPNAITLSILNQLAPDALLGDTVLILNPAQFESDDLQEWLSHPSQMTFLNGKILNCDHCISTDEHGRIHLCSDGVGLWVDGSE